MKIKFLQWNVLYKENPDHIAQEIKSLGVDVVVAQEFIQDSRKNIDTAKQVAGKLGFNYFYQAADTWDNHPDRESQGNAVFSRFPIVGTYYTHINSPKHNPINALEEGRVYVEVSLDIKGKELTVGTTHLSFAPYFKITDQRKNEADNLIKAIKNKKTHYIFGADLNATPDSYTVTQLEKYLQNVGPDDDKKTFANKPFDYRGMFEVKGIEWRIDHAFASNDIQVTSAQVVKTKYSDHLPILVEIEL
jgi:endonuclease/exonuclease/phosphatase family metal-dependent hydrolase